jgi:predicted DNA-binding ribbon-helix-helix protein
MLRHMRTTVRLDQALLERVKAEATRRNTTLTSLIEEGLELLLRRPLKRNSPQPLRLTECRAGGGTLPGVDLDDSASLLDRLENRH